jgi:hypothetical protein
VLSRIPAERTQIPALELSITEADACAEALIGILNAFIPDVSKIDPKTAAVLGGITVFGSIGFQKYEIYRRETANRAPPPVVPANTPPPDQFPPNPGAGAAGVPADSYFRKSQ